MISQHIQPPPRLLLGAALLFWGAMAGQSPLALILALIIESPNWIRSRWNFDDKTCSRAWHLSLVFTALAIVPIWLDGNRHTTIPRLLTWLPALLFPLQFVQSFGFYNYLNLSNFYFFSHINIKRNSELGIRPSIVRFNFGNVYFVTIILAASLGSLAQHNIFFPGLIILTSWLILARVRNRFFAMTSILLLAAVIGFSGQIGMTKLYQWANNHGLNLGGIPSSDPTLKRTNIGSLGAIKQSHDMVWRITPQAEQMPPRLLKTASYNRYKGVNWKAQYPSQIPDDEENFRELDAMDLSAGDAFYLLRENMQRRDLIKPLPSFEIRGAATPGDPLPIPGSSATLQNFLFDGIDINPVGTVRIFPQKSIILGKVRWKDNIDTESLPFPVEDLAIDEYEFEGIHEVADALGLKQLSTTAEKVRRIQSFFTKEFEYTRYLTIAHVYTSLGRPTAIETFLTTSKRGHCEYFATAATLLLRAANVPARYCIGYSVMEKNPSRNEWIIRGTHAHAWTRVWDESLQRWLDFDSTPVGWLETETGGGHYYQLFLDAYQRIKEDFFLWRNQAKNRLAVTIVAWVLGLSVILYIVIRLKKSRVVIRSGKSALRSGLPTIKTPLHDLEKSALKILGSRSPGETLVAWLMKLKSHSISEEKLETACTLHQQIRFDPAPSTEETSNHLSAVTQKIIHELKNPATEKTKK